MFNFERRCQAVLQSDHTLSRSFVSLSKRHSSHSVVSGPTTLWTTAHQASLSLTISWSLRKLMSTELVMLSNHLILYSSPSSPAFNLSQHQSLFQRVSSSLRQPKYSSFSFSISPSNEYSRLISFRMDWFDFLAAQGTLKSLLQHHSSNASILWCSAFLMVQPSHPYMTPDFLDCIKRHAYFLPGGQSFLFSLTAFSMKRVGDILEQPCFLLGDASPASSLAMRALQGGARPGVHTGREGTLAPCRSSHACLSHCSFGARF